MKHPLPTWIVPLGDNAAATITIDDGLNPPAIRLDMPELVLGVMTKLGACRLGMALQEASRVAGQLAAKRSR